ncbi:MAG: hypothetical protein MZW92_22685 [Comamonadaceae bacterium]|nr:hypothetical protein [Comamonadaceae bacterium]
MRRHLTPGVGLATTTASTTGGVKKPTSARFNTTAGRQATAGRSSSGFGIGFEPARPSAPSGSTAPTSRDFGGHRQIDLTT